MTAAIIKFPERLCAMCGRKATQTIDLIDEYGSGAGKKHLCDDYPFCTDPDLMDEVKSNIPA